MPVVSVSGCRIENGCQPRGFIVGSESPGLCPSLADAQAEIARLRGALEALEADAHLIFNNPPSECPQIARDVIEWYASSIRVALEPTK